VSLRLIGVLCDRLRRTTEQVEDMLFRDLPSRLAKKLLELADAGGERGATGLRTVSRLSQRELGAMVGMSRESINKQLRQWQDDGLVVIDVGSIALKDERALHALADLGS
jgi:CRP/FNR family cyclic AMP-dependent transcriptional regulator